ncbi:MAG TPA: hypothetical protein VEP68_12615 [Anaeromyxobacteraceae bacterium]|nr:hypothetical protein [Anaeromyxobacteraceae bacterium]
MTALALTLWLLLAQAPDGGPGGAPDPAGRAGASDGGAPGRGSPDGGAPDPDAEVIESLELLEQLDLLDRLEILDADAPTRARGGPPPR